MKKLICLFGIFAFAAQMTWAQEGNIDLPKPLYTQNQSLHELLANRHSSRDFSQRDLSKQDLANLLWAAFGVNREESGKRTAPSAMNWQDITLYVTLKSGVYYYDAKAHKLVKVLDKDARKETGSQDFVAFVPLNIVYVSDYDKMGDAKPEQKQMYSAAHTGFIGQNVYLFCTSYGLNTVFRGAIDRDLIHKTLELKPNQHVVFCQSIGWSPTN